MLLLTLKQDQRPDIYILSLDSTLFNVTKELSIASAITPSWSPDGMKIAFNARKPEDDEIANIWVINRDGSQAQQLTFDDLVKYQLLWLPQSNTIAYVAISTDLDVAGLYIVDVASKETKQVLKGPMSIAMSQNEDLLAFTPAFDYRDPKQGEIYNQWCKSKFFDL